MGYFAEFEDRVTPSGSSLACTAASSLQPVKEQRGACQTLSRQANPLCHKLSHITGISSRRSCCAPIAAQLVQLLSDSTIMLGTTTAKYKSMACIYTAQPII